MSGDISLHDLVNLSIGSPEAGAVNFNALHTLLHAILGHLKIRDVTTNWKEEDSSQPEPDGQPQTKSCGERCGPYHHMEDKLRQIERQIAMIENLPTGTDLLERTSSSTTPVNDMWQLMQVRCKIQTNEDGVSKSMELIQDLLKEIQDLKEFRDSLKNEVKNLQKQLDQMSSDGLAERVTVVENYCHRVDELEAATRTLKERVLQYPEPEDMDQCVTWDVMHTALLSEREQLHQELAASGSIDPTSHFRAPAKPLVPDSPLVLAKPLVHGSQSTPGKTLTSPRPSAPHKPSTHPTPPETGTPPGRVPVSSPSLTQQTSSDPGLEAIGIPLSRVASITERYPETVEALRHLGRLRKRHDHLEARVMTLEAIKVDQAQLALLRELITNMGARDLPDNLMDQLNHISALVASLMSDREKLDNLEEMFMNLGSTEQENTSEEAPETMDSENVGSRQLKVQISCLRMVVQELEEDMKELKGRGALSGQKTTDRHLQDQLDHLRGMPEDLMASPSSPLSRSLQEETGQEDQSDSQGLGQGQGQRQGQEDVEFATCAVDIGRNISLLLLRYEQLQDTVNGILKQQTTGGKAENTELMNDVQKAILQLQAECERLHDKTSHLVEDSSQKQSHIQQLYKTVEELEEKKADKQLLEMEIEIKADKCALDSKVSRMQFDTTTEQLNAMFRELLTKVTGQEQDWHKVIDRLSTEMECKLNRIELESVKKQLEDRWKNIRKRLEAQPAPEHEDAAGIKKQLVARFHCISCDRPVSMQASGPHLVTLPSAPGLPSNKSNRPYTVYELEQVRQHYRRPGTNVSNFEMVNTERSMLQLHRKRMMCRQIAQVQSQLDHFETLHIQGSIKETQARYLPILSPLPKTSHSRPKHERIPEMADYSYLAMSRSCGGSHTAITYPNRRYTRLQHITHFLQAEVEGQPLSPSQLRFQPEEVDILGLDGHVYKGRLNTRAIRTADARLPTISPKEGMCKGKDKVMRCPSQRSGGPPEPGHATPVLPQSAKTQRSRSTSSSSARDRPVSVLGCMSQGQLPQGSPQDGELQAGIEPHVVLGQEEEPVTTL